MSGGDVEIVDFQSVPIVKCSMCGEETENRWGLPIDVESGEIVPDDWQGKWGAIPVCQTCNDMPGEFVGMFPRF